MRRRVDEGKEKRAPALEIPTDTINEAVVLAAALVDAQVRARLLKLLPPDRFHLEQHRGAWRALGELERRGLSYDPATIRAVAGDAVSLDYLSTLVAHRPAVAPNLTFHVDAVLWNHARVEAARGPLAGFLQAMQEVTAPPERVKALARQVAASFDGYEARRYLKDPSEVVRQVIAGIDERMRGRSIHPFGIPGLDMYEDGYETSDGIRNRIIPGSAPGKVTLVTGLSGSGKSTFIKFLILGIVSQGRKVLYGCWEEDPEEAMRDLAAMSLHVSRRRIEVGAINDDERRELAERAELLAAWVRVLENPFLRRVRERSTNDANLDVLHGYIADSGCEVFVADLWERCLTDTDPEEEKMALFRQQAMAAETQTHVILAAQQRLGELEKRADKKPTREGVKGSKAYIEVADLVIGTHRPSLFKSIPDDRFLACILKQRRAPWPMIVEFESDIDRGILRGGTTLPYESSPERAEDSLGVQVKTRKGGRSS